MADYAIVLKEEIVNKSKHKNRLIMEKLHNYMKENNMELVNYLDKKKDYVDFLIRRSDNAIDEFNYASDANFTDPYEIMNQVLFTGVENSCSEYVESMICELPDEIKENLRKSKNYKIILEKLINDCVPVFYEFIGTPYSSSQESLDKKLLKRMKKSLTEF